MTRTRRALVCAPLMPEYDREGGSRLIYNTIMFLAESGWAVSFVAENSRGGERYARHLRRCGVATYNGFSDLTDEVIANGRFDLAVFAFWHLAELYAPRVRELSPGTRVVVDMIDLHFVRNARRLFQEVGARSGDSLDGGYADEMARELRVYAAADGVIAVSQKEADLVNLLLNAPSLALAAPIGEDMPPSRIPFDDRRGILFLGNFRHPPNIQAAEFLIGEVLPHVDPGLLETHRVSVVGNDLPETVARLGEGLDHVRMVGWVPSVFPYLEWSRTTVVPLLYGAGTKVKLLQALTVGTPTVSTTVGVEGMGLEDGEHVLISDDPVAFARSIERLLCDQGLWGRLASRGREFIRIRQSREAAKDQRLRIFDTVLTRRPRSHDPRDDREGAPTAPRKLPYKELIRRVREVVRSATPEGATVIVISKGDDQLLKFDGRRGWHLPQNAAGVYAGHHPADSAEAVSILERLRGDGAGYLLIPATSFWWLEHYDGFGRHLKSNYQVVHSEEGVCILFGLTPRSEGSWSQRRGPVTITRPM